VLLIPSGQLDLGCSRIHPEIDVQRFDRFPRDPPSLDQIPQRVVNAQAQDRLQLLVRVARGRLPDHTFERRAQRPVHREANVLVEPEALRIEARNPRERVVAACVAVARVVPGALQGSQDRRPGASLKAPPQIL
jgi:hypothetical protein